MSFTNLTERIQQVGVAKVLLLIVAAFVVLALVLALIGTAFSGFGRTQRSPSYVTFDQKGSFGMAERAAYDSAASAPSVSGDVALSYRNIVPPDGGQGYVPGNDAEEFEARSFNAAIRTGDLDGVCNTILGWKPEPYVVFLEETRTESACYVRFKVERARVDDVVALLTALRPDDLTVRTETIREQVLDHTSRLDILLGKQKVTEETLEQAARAYDELLALARSAEDVASLSKVIDSKLAQIERLTREQIAIASEIEAVTRQKAAAMDRLDYAEFTVRVSKFQIVDLTGLRESWVAALQQFVRTLNTTLQAMTLGLIAALLHLALFLIYVIVLLVLVKHGWRLARDFWQR